MKTPLQELLQYESDLTHMFDSDVKVGLALLEYIRTNKKDMLEKEKEMKTPIQELIVHFIDAWSSPSDLWKPSKVIEKIESMLEKEKEFIVSQQRELLDWLSNESEHNIIKSEINEILEDFKYYQSNC